MKKILYKAEFSDNAEGILLATFDEVRETVETTRSFIFRKTITRNVIEKRFLVFTPYRHHMKRLEVIRQKDTLSRLEFDDSLTIVESDGFESIDPDDPFAAIVIRNFKGCDFVLNDKSFIIKVLETDMYSALETLYDNIPNIINEVFDEEQ